MEIKTIWRFFLILVRMANIKKTNTANAGEDVENSQPWGTAGRNVNFYSHSRKPYGGVSNEEKKKSSK